MIVRNRLRPGEYVSLIPVGQPCTLEYDQHGNLSKVYSDYEYKTKLDFPLDVIAAIDGVQNNISLKGGTTRVVGALFIGNTLSGNGPIPECIQDEVRATIESNPAGVTFYAGYVTSLAAEFLGAQPIKMWLTANNFKQVPGFLMPNSTDENVFIDCIVRACNGFEPFAFPHFMDMFVFNSSGMHIIHTNIFQYTVQDSSINITESGVWQIDIQLPSVTKRYPYFNYITFNINKGTKLFLDEQDNILMSYNDHDAPKHSSDVICPGCNKKIRVVPHQTTMCDNLDCRTRMYPRITHLLKTFNLPILSFEKYVKYVDDGKIQTIIDVLDVKEYKSTEISASLPKAISAVWTSSDDPAISAAISKFCNHCKQNKDTVLFYLNNFNRIATDLTMTQEDIQILRSWFYNNHGLNAIQEFESLLSVDHLTILEQDRLFDGAPMFHNKVIGITGDFLHGPQTYISDILRSYSATVAIDAGTGIDMLVIGGKLSNIDGEAVRSARLARVPVIEEPAFFAHYQIDEDLQANL